MVDRLRKKGRERERERERKKDGRKWLSEDLPLLYIKCTADETCTLRQAGRRKTTDTERRGEERRGEERGWGDERSASKARNGENVREKPA